jgi:hypothetical protein
MEMKQQATRVSASGIGEIAKQGVERALAARSSAVVLSEEQTEQVGGGALPAALMIPIIAGGIWGPIDIFAGRLGGGLSVPKTLGGAAGPATLGA